MWAFSHWWKFLGHVTVITNDLWTDCITGVIVAKEQPEVTLPPFIVYHQKHREKGRLRVGCCLVGKIIYFGLFVSGFQFNRTVSDWDKVL